jgi:hypothetical protein
MATPVIAGRGIFAPGATIRCTLLAAAVALAGCTTDMDKGLCPSAFVLAPTSSLTVFRAGAPSDDPSGELYTVSMSGMKTKCEFDKKKTATESEVTITFRAKRAASSEGGTYNVPYFLSVTHHGDRIMTKKLFIAHVIFAPGAVSTTFEDKIDSTVIHIARGSKIGEYEILGGLQLTKEQLDYNIKMNRYAQ